MRALSLAVLSLGAIMVAAEAEAQEKKAEKEAISIRRWIAAQKMFLDPKETKGFLEEVKGKTYWRINGSEPGFAGAEDGSEIAAKGGTWIVETEINTVGGPRKFRCKLKDPSKKD
ncbi:hypothetical protein [Gemmata sp.]|uniref:hypothetical protein n=1 Tax=Gemmata sp. TaxID=1914242 RepID=UPI003F70ABD7